MRCDYVHVCIIDKHTLLVVGVGGMLCNGTGSLQVMDGHTRLAGDEDK